MSDNYRRPEHYSDDGFWSKVKNIAGKTVLNPALELYYTAKSANTPTVAKGLAIGALGYLILPVDLIPDFIPVAGFSDDIVAMMTAIKSLAVYVTPDVKAKAESKVRELMNI